MNCLHVNFFFLNFSLKNVRFGAMFLSLTQQKIAVPLVTAQQKGSDLSEIAFGCLEG